MPRRPGNLETSTLSRARNGRERTSVISGSTRAGTGSGVRRKARLEPRQEAGPNGRHFQSTLFKSFFAAGFECSTHFRKAGMRLDLIASTRHDEFARLDYERITQQGMRVAREGLRWHRIEKQQGKYDFESVLPIADAAAEAGTQVIWDLCHFGWPDGLDLFSSEFVSRLGEYGAAFAEWIFDRTGSPPFIVPVNEISFFSWASGDEGSMFPFITGRGHELKGHLVQASIQAMRSIRSAVPGARFVHVDPIIHVVASPAHPEEKVAAEAYRLSQYQAWDMLCGRLRPELGGAEEFLDIVGVNFYPHNQWIYNLKDFHKIRKFAPVTRRNPLWRPLRTMLKEVYKRYQRPMLIAETGAEDRRRAGWLRYVCEESQAAIADDVPLEGICLYPIINHPGWVDDRHCHNGLWDYADDKGNREIYTPLARELGRWRQTFEGKAPGEDAAPENNSLDLGGVSQVE
ncbi:MAG TPA: beta-glucosidase [Verrucomicrobiae bacterium]|nr:beta-glucosidase [Verrucomicrobiae bacterium]